MTKAKINALRITTLLGVVVSVYLVQQHLNYKFNSGELGFCEAVKFFDCGATEDSRFSEVAGIPTAAFGMIYFMIFAGFVISGFRSGAEERTVAAQRKVAALLSLIGLATSAMLALISGVAIGSFCLGCSVVYLLSIVSVGLVMKGGPGVYLSEATGGVGAGLEGIRGLLVWDGRQGLRLGQQLALGITFILAPLAIAWAPIAKHRSFPVKVQKIYMEQPVVKFKPGHPAMIKGDPSAPINLVVFTDFECPSCIEFHPLLKQVLEEFEGQYRITYKHFPLNEECNPPVKGSGIHHPKACRLAELAQGLAGLEKFWDASDMLYGRDNPAILGLMKRVSDANEIDIERWVAEADSAEARAQVKADIAEGNSIDLRAIPGIYVNGRKLTILGVPHLEVYMRHALWESKRPS